MGKERRGNQREKRKIEKRGEREKDYQRGRERKK